MSSRSGMPGPVWGVNEPHWGCSAASFFYNAANDNLFVVFGAWLEQAFGLSIVDIGMGASLIGMAELFGEVLTASACSIEGNRSVKEAQRSFGVLFDQGGFKRSSLSKGRPCPEVYR